MNPARRDVCEIRWTHRMRLYLLIVALATAVMFVTSACTNIIVPPQHVQDAQTVYLLDHGRTPSLVLPDASGGMIRYGYGDWEWYALGQRDAWHAIKALCWPTRGTLGRMPLRGPADEANVRRQVHIVIEQLHAVDVEREAVARLRAKLDQIWHDNQDTLIVRAESEFGFVHHPEAYSALNNSSGVIADWLEELGAEVKGWALLSDWRVERD